MTGFEETISLHSFAIDDLTPQDISTKSAVFQSDHSRSNTKRRCKSAPSIFRALYMGKKCARYFWHGRYFSSMNTHIA